MAVRVEWRLREGADALLLLDESERAVSEVCPPDQSMLQSYLATAETAETWKHWDAWRPVAGGRDPEAWGDLVLSRAESGQILSIDPELFWAGVYRWFRSRGVDF